MIEYCFPQFLESEPSESQHDLGERLKRQGVNRVLYQTRFERRYAGDLTLTRGSYYSLCDANGDDMGTLASEMNAYREAKVGEYVIALDFADLDAAGQAAFQHLGHRGVYVVVHPAVGLMEFIEGKGIQPARPLASEDTAVLAVPLSIGRSKIPRVLDLREPKARDWFFKTFRHGDGEFFLRFDGSNCENFYQMLPELMNPKLGGCDFNSGAVTQGVGLALRAWRIEALVFPSARNDVEVEVLNGRVRSATGFNLVDYRGSPRIGAISRHADLSSGWRHDVVGDETIEFASSGPNAGSFRCSGVRYQNALAYERAWREMHPNQAPPISITQPQ